jgi:hypothetical protein
VFLKAGLGIAAVVLVASMGAGVTPNNAQAMTTPAAQPSNHALIDETQLVAEARELPCLADASTACLLGCFDSSLACGCRPQIQLEFKAFEDVTPALLAQNANDYDLSPEAPAAWKMVVEAARDGHLTTTEFVAIKGAVELEPRYTVEDRATILLAVHDWFEIPGN